MNGRLYSTPQHVLGVHLLAGLLCLTPAVGQDLDPGEPPALSRGEISLGAYQVGLSLSRRGEHLAARPHFEKALALCPYWPLPYLEMAVAHMMTDNDRQRIGGYLTRGVQVGKDNPRAHLLYGIYLQEEKEGDRAVQQFTEALSLRPSLVDARLRLASLYLDGGQQDEGIREFTAVLGLEPDNIGAHRNLALLLERAGRLAEAEAHLLSIVRLQPRSGFHLSNLGQFYQRVGWNQKASAAIGRAKRLDAIDKRKMRPLRSSPAARR